MILPDNISFSEWMANLCIDFPISFQPVNVDEKNWQEYAKLANLIPEIAVTSPPDPYSYTDWRAWARRLIELNF